MLESCSKWPTLVLVNWLKLLVRQDCKFIGYAELEVTGGAVNPLCINLFLTNSSRSFQDTQVIETSLLDFHKVNLISLENIIGR